MQPEGPAPVGRHRFGRWLGCVLAAGLLTGCTLESLQGPPQTTTVEVPLAPDVNEPLQEPVKGSLDLAPVEDAQWTANKRLLAYGESESQIFVSKRPLAEIFQDGLSNALRQNGFMSTNQPRFVLRTRLEKAGWLPIEVELSPEYQKFGLTTGYEDVPPEYRRNGSSFLDSGPPRRLGVQVIFQLIDPRTKRPAWSFDRQPVWEFKCYGLLRTPEYYAAARSGQGFARTSEDAILQLITNETFRAYFETKRTNAP